MLSNEKRICEYFAISGFSKSRKPYDLSQIYYQGEEICNANVELAKDFFHYKEPIVDIQIVSTNQREKVPEGFHIVDRTYSKQNKADLNGKTAVDELYLCFRCGRDQPPITDICAFNPKQKNHVNQEGWILIEKTVSGHSANLHTTSSNPLFLAYKRALANAPVDNLVVTDICVILTNKNEICPPAYSRVDVAIKRTALSHTINVCYKKSIVKQHVLTYQPEVIYCLPSTSTEPIVDVYNPDPDKCKTSNCLPDDIRDVANFCMPWGATLESWPSALGTPKPSFVTFVLTNMNYDRMYGAAMLFYEAFEPSALTAEESSSLSPTLATGPPSIFSSKSICLLSRWPLFHTFNRVLSFLIQEDERQRLDDSKQSSLPLERFISQFLHSVPFPTPEAPNILLQWDLESAIRLQLPTDAISKSGTVGENFYQLVRILEVEEIVQLFVYMLTEQKILLTSTCNRDLTGIAEALISMIFPFKWSVVYIPFLYLGCIHIIQSPSPYLIGVDSTFFDYFRLPEGVGCVDLINKSIKPPVAVDGGRPLDPMKVLPKTVLRALRQSLGNCKTKVLNFEKEQGLRMMAGKMIDEFTVQRKKENIGESIKECFLRAVTLMFRNYQRFLVPVTFRQRNRDDDMFNVDGFLKSVDKNSRPLYQAIFDTQLWNHFILERSYATEFDDSLAFFDRCIKLVQTMDEEQASISSLFQTDSVVRSEHTKVVPPPDPVEGWQPSSSDGAPRTTFPQRLDSRLLLPPPPPPLETPLPPRGTSNQALLASPDSSSLPVLLLRVSDHSGPPAKSSVLRRPFEELKQARHLARDAKKGPPHAWAGHLLASSYCLWYLSLPGLLGYVLDTVGLAESGLADRILQLAIEMLGALRSFRLPLPDEVCCRVLLLLVHQLRPARLRVEDIQNQAELNAFSYGLCNQILLEEETQMIQMQGLSRSQLEKDRVDKGKEVEVNEEKGPPGQEERDCDSGRETLASDNNVSSGRSDRVASSVVTESKKSTEESEESDHCMIEIGGKVVRLRGRHQWPRKHTDRMSQMLFSFPTELCATDSERSHQFLDPSAGIIMSSAPRKGASSAPIVPIGTVPPILTMHKSPSTHAPPHPTVLIRCPFDEEKSDLHCSFMPKKRDRRGEEDEEEDEEDDEEDDDDIRSSNTVANVIKSLRDWQTQQQSHQQVEPVLRSSEASLAHSDLGPSTITNKTRASFRQLRTAANKSLRSIMSSVGSGGWMGGSGGHQPIGMPSTFRPWESNQTNNHGNSGSVSTSSSRSRMKTTASAEVLDTVDSGDSVLHPSRPCAGTVQQLRRRDHYWTGIDGGSSESVRSDQRVDQYSSTSSFDGDPPILTVDKVWEGITGSLAAVQLPAGKFWEQDAAEDETGQAPPSVECTQALTVHMTTCSGCPHCQALVYDDDIMSGWSCNDSDLQSLCAYCRERFSPRLSFQVFIRSTVQTAAMHDRPILVYQSETNYLSPFVLRKELESVLQQEGEVALLGPGLLQDHSILYWNLLWCYSRLQLPSHMLSFLTLWLRQRGRALVRASNGDPACTAKYEIITELTGHEQVYIYQAWELNQLSGRTGMPLYRKYNANMLSNGEMMTPQRNVLQKIVRSLFDSDMRSAIDLVLKTRTFCASGTSPLPLATSARSAYRELMFLAIVALDRFNLSLDTFHHMYESHWRHVAKAAPQLSLPHDLPPSEAALHCRRLLRPLLLL